MISNIMTSTLPNPYLSGLYAISITSDLTISSSYTNTSLNYSAYGVPSNYSISSLTVENSSVQIYGGGGNGGTYTAFPIFGTNAQGGSHAIINYGGITNLYNYGILQGGGGGGGTIYDDIIGVNGQPGNAGGTGGSSSSTYYYAGGGSYGNYPPSNPPNNQGTNGTTGTGPGPFPVVYDGGGGGGGGGGGSGGGTSSISSSNQFGNGGCGGYSIVNQNYITSFYNSQGSGNPVYFYNTGTLTNYYINVNITNSTTTYGQLFYYGYSQTINFDIDPNSSINITTSTTLEYAIYDSGSNLTINNTSGSINSNSKTYYWYLSNISTGRWDLIINLATGYITNNQDLREIFQPYTSGTQAALTSYKTNNQDLSEIFQPYTSGTQTATGYKTNNQDLSEIFQPI